MALHKIDRVYATLHHSLYIAGQFISSDTYKDLLEIKGENIVVIEDRFVETEEYYRLLSESKFCILPYDPDFYKNNYYRT